jgi:hypothetical protein
MFEVGDLDADPDVDDCVAELPDGLLADADAVPAWLDEGGPPLSLGNCAPSGWLALDLDTSTGDPRT